jgi:hypothetical protein
MHDDVHDGCDGVDENDHIINHFIITIPSSSSSVSSDQRHRRVIIIINHTKHNAFRIVNRQ